MKVWTHVPGSIFQYYQFLSLLPLMLCVCVCAGLEYIRGQDPEVLLLRIEIMVRESCEEFALNLCSWSLRHPALQQNNLKIKEFQIYILYKQGEYQKMQEVVRTSLIVFLACTFDMVECFRISLREKQDSIYWYIHCILLSKYTLKHIQKKLLPT